MAKGLAWEAIPPFYVVPNKGYTYRGIRRYLTGGDEATVYINTVGESGQIGLYASLAESGEGSEPTTPLELPDTDEFYFLVGGTVSEGEALGGAKCLLLTAVSGSGSQQRIARGFLEIITQEIDGVSVEVDINAIVSGILSELPETVQPSAAIEPSAPVNPALPSVAVEPSAPVNPGSTVCGYRAFCSSKSGSSVCGNRTECSGESRIAVCCRRAKCTRKSGSSVCGD